MQVRLATTSVARSCRRSDIAAPLAAGGAPQPRQQREPGRYVYDDPEGVVPPYPRHQQRTPPYDDDDDDKEEEDDSISDSGERRGARSRSCRSIRRVLKRVRRTVFPCTVSDDYSTSTSSGGRSSRARGHTQAHRRRLPDPPIDPYLGAAGAPAGNYGGLAYGPPPPVMTYPFGYPAYGWSSCDVCLHPASHRPDCPVYIESLRAEASHNHDDPTEDRSTSRATARESRRRHNRSPEGIPVICIFPDFTAYSSQSAERRSEKHQKHRVAGVPMSPRRSTREAGQTGNPMEGPRERVSVWAAPPIARAQNTPAPDMVRTHRSMSIRYPELLSVSSCCHTFPSDSVTKLVSRTSGYSNVVYTKACSP